MNTLKSLKITSVAQGIFFLCGVLALFLLDYMNLAFFKVIFYSFVINPIGIVSFMINVAFFIKESKDDSKFISLGKKWPWIFVWPVVNGALGLVYFFVHIMMF